MLALGRGTDLRCDRVVHTFRMFGSSTPRDDDVVAVLVVVVVPGAGASTAVAVAVDYIVAAAVAPVSTAADYTVAAAVAPASTVAGYIVAVAAAAAAVDTAVGSMAVAAAAKTAAEGRTVGNTAGFGFVNDGGLYRPAYHVRIARHVDPRSWTIRPGLRCRLVLQNRAFLRALVHHLGSPDCPRLARPGAWVCVPLPEHGRPMHRSGHGSPPPR